MSRYGDRSTMAAVLFDSNSESLRKYDVLTHEWSRVQAYLPEMRKWCFTAVAFGNDIYIFLSNKSVFRLQHNVESSKWSQMPDTLYDHKQYPPVTVFEGSLHVVGSAGFGVEMAYGERFDEEEHEWVALPHMQLARRSHAIASTADALYCIGGMNVDGELLSVEKYSPKRGDWTYVAPMISPRHSAAAAELDDKIYVSCGWGAGKRLCDVDMYDAASNVWSAIQATNIPRSLHKACVAGGEIFVIGGDPDSAETMEIYSMEKKRWRIISLTDMRIDAAVSVP